MDKELILKIKALAPDCFSLLLKLFIFSIHLLFTLRPKVQNNPQLSISSDQVLNKERCPHSSALRGFPSGKANQSWN